jgi:trehalose 6-phosphate synthase
MVVSLLRSRGGHWFYADNQPRPETSQDPDISLHPLSIPDDVANAHYNTISRQTLLWLFHYLFDTSHSPTFDPTVGNAWGAYEDVNRQFAEAVAAQAGAESESLIFVNDYHLALVPGYVRPKTSSHIIYFHHVPWCAADYFGILPSVMRLSLLESLLCSDVVGFHSDRWADAFVETCERFLPGADVGRRQIRYRDRTTAIAVAPGPVDADVLENLKSEPYTDSLRAELSRRRRGRRTVVRVDRLDLWKNVVRGFQAFELLLERNPRTASDVWFCAMVTPSRVETSRHVQYRRDCEEAASRVNARFGGRDPGSEPVSLLYPQKGRNTRHRSIAALAEADATLVNPTYDGLNLVAKEAVVTGDGPLLLSVGAGAYPQLRDAVVPLEPFDLESTCDALTCLLAGEPAAVQQSRQKCKVALKAESATAWFDSLVRALP